jgi:mono/diheme cytochrome c family protein
MNPIRKFPIGMACVSMVVISTGLGSAIARGDEPSRDAQAAAVLARHCLECHNAAEGKGGLDLTRRDRALAGGDSGKVLVPGSPQKSELVQRIDAGTMPPGKRTKLGKEERALLRQWVEAGAKWAADPIDVFRYTSERRAGYDWWSLQPLRAVKPPEVGNSTWAINEVDHFILQRLEKAGLSPAPAAEARTLIRRLYFDLIGLPPTPDEVEHWVSRLTADKSGMNEDAYRELVDELLASPHYGERWARHWLDLVRFGESQGFERNKFRPSAWKYRDFVVEAFNADMPYDRFVRWQLAGDVLQPDDPLAVIASGFLVMGPYDLTAYNNGTADMRAFARQEELEGLVGTVCQTFLGLTVNCARCHDHKFDPIRQEEFYQISAALGGTYQGDERESLSPAGKKAVEKRIAELRAEIDALGKREGGADRQHALAARRSRLQAVEQLLDGGPVHTIVPRQPGPWRVLARGDFRKPGKTVEPHGIPAVTGVSPDWKLDKDAREADRRVALAGWITDPGNPLTARVIVNRLWGWHFGQGLVQTPSDLGFQGGLPSHPELLDWLAGQLVKPADGPTWSLKRIQRTIVTSATYRQSSRAVPRAMEIDADNRLLWRRLPHRLEAEAFRDSVLAVSGELDLQIGGPGFRDYTVSSAGNNETYTVFDAVGPKFNRRSLYRTCVRSGTSPLLDTLDCPDPSVASPRRSVTTTPLQALALLNNKFMEHYAARFAERLKREAGADPAAQIRRVYSLAFAREPAAKETAFGRKYIAEHGLAEYCLVLFNLNEFVFVD